MDSQHQIYATLRTKGMRVTAQKRLILDVFLKNQNRMLSVADVYALLPEGASIDNATVYRNIQKFLSLGILETINDEQGVNRYMILDREHHHYMICTECGKIIKIPCEGCFWTPYAQQNNFHETHHKLEVYGKCGGCAGTKEA